MKICHITDGLTIFFSNFTVTEEGGHNLLNQLVSSIRALSGSGSERPSSDMIVPMSLIDRNKYLKRHWSSWTDEDIELDRERATERLKMVPARSGLRCVKALISMLMTTRLTLITHANKLNHSKDDKSGSIRQFILAIDPVIFQIQTEVKRAIMFVSSGEDTRFVPHGSSSIDLTTTDLRFMREGKTIARDRAARARGRGFRGARSRGSFRGRGGYSAGRDATLSSVLQVLQDQRRPADRPARRAAGGNCCYICGSEQHFARNCPDRK